MKKITSLALCLLMALSMASCSQTAETEENTTPAVTEEVTETEETVFATFDSSWTESEYASLIPEPPLCEYSTEITEGSDYTLFTMMNTASPSTDYLHITEDTFLAYIELLQNVGYVDHLVNAKTAATCIYFSAWKENVEVSLEYSIWDEDGGYISYIDICVHE